MDLQAADMVLRGDNVEQRRFGDSDLVCSALGFGTWEMSTTQYGAIDIGEASRAVNSAIDRGITLFDTAEVYGPYHSEEILGRALGRRRQEIILVTKVGFRISEEGRLVGRNSTRGHITAHAEACLERLGTDWIDLLLIHWPDHDTPYDEPIRALEGLKASGKIRHYGVSNFSPAMMDVCEKAGHLTANQVGYHLFDRRMERAVLPYCAEHSIGFMAYGTLGYGLLTGAFTPETTFVDWDWRSRGTAFRLPLFQREDFLKELRVVERLKALAASHGKSVAQLAIACVLDHPAVTVALVGMRNTRELDENVAAVDWKLSNEDRAEIDRIFQEEGVPTYREAAQAL
jgi:aryl-alcohol dehydrogenase-like predicted oxidoreductase